LRDSLILLFLTLVVFGASLGASFHFDDYAILSDPILTSPSGWWQVWGPMQTRPLAWFTFWVNYRLGGRNPAGYHAVNLALHLSAVLLLFLLLRDLLPRKAAFIAAAIFALHPIQAEPVLYVFARPILLATVFCLLSLRAWSKERRWTAVPWFALALLAKEECVAFPLFLWLSDTMSENFTETKGLHPVFRTLCPKAPWATLAMLGLSLAAGLRVIYATAVVHGAGAGFQAGISPARYLAAQGWVILRYLRLLVLPWGFNVDPEIHAHWIAWIGVAALVGLALWRRIFWFLGGLVLLAPSSSIFPVADLAADRRMYLPMIGFSAAAGLLLSKVDRRIPIGIALLLAALSFGRARVWQTEESLWSEAVRLSPGKVRPKIQLARAVPPARALGLLEEANRIAPDDPLVASEIGRMYMQLGDPARALAEFGRELALSPGAPAALNNRGAALLALGQDAAARQDFERALERDPCFFDARFNLKRLGVETPPPAECRYTSEQERLLGSESRRDACRGFCPACVPSFQTLTEPH